MSDRGDVDVLHLGPACRETVAAIPAPCPMNAQQQEFLVEAWAIRWLPEGRPGTSRLLTCRGTMLRNGTW